MCATSMCHCRSSSVCIYAGSLPLENCFEGMTRPSTSTGVFVHEIERCVAPEMICKTMADRMDEFECR